MSTWAEFYESRMGDDYLKYVKNRYIEHINAITCFLNPGVTSVELGCGTATITRALFDREPNRSYVYCDNNTPILEMAIDRMECNGLPLYRNILKPLKVEQFNINPYVMHTHGVLEHFSDEDIRKIINLHRGAKAQVHYVPGLYPNKSFGDERLMPAHRWQEICNPSSIITFNNGLDYCLIFNQ
jgi:hypothetical protein